MKPLSQNKVEHAVLWSLVREAYSSEFADARTIRAHLLDTPSEQQVRAALHHLVECGLIENRSASMQEEFCPTREGILVIERLEPISSSFVGRLSLHGPKWLRSPSAGDAELNSKLEVTKKPSPPRVDSPEMERSTAASSLTIVNQVNPNLSNTQNSGSDDAIARSAKNAGWFGGWGAWVGAALALAGLLVVLHEAKLI